MQKSTLVLGILLSLFITNSFAVDNSYYISPTAKTNLPPTSPSEPETSPLSGNFDITTNYVFRGISQSNNLPAFQGGLTYTFVTTGIYLNLWGSNVNQLDYHGDTATLEVDAIAGITNPIGENFTYDINIDRYNYPQSASLNYNELIANAKYYFVTGQIGYSNNVYNSNSSGTYYNIGIDYEIPPKYVLHLNDVSISGGVGHYSLPRNKGLYSYNDVNVQLSKKMGIYTLSFQWTDSSNQNFYGNLGGNHFLATVLVEF